MRSQPNPRSTWASGNDDTGFNLIVILVGCGLGFYLLWTNYHPGISTAVMTLHHVEIGFIRNFTSRFDLADRQMMAADPADVTLPDLYGIARDVGVFFRIPAAVLMVLLAIICTLRAAPSRYRRNFDLDALIREQAVSFRTTAAFVGRHLRLVPPAQPPRPADYALTPDEWIARFATAGNGGLDEPAARSALARQLGPKWRGPRHAEPHVRCMFVVFALHLADRREEAVRLLGIMSIALSARNGDSPEGPSAPLTLPRAVIASAESFLVDDTLMSPADAIAAHHAYTHTALMGLLNEARLRAGVLAPGQFAWLKLIDRDLWYALHSLGFETEGPGLYLHPNPRVEASGARDHWAVERMVGEPVNQPSVDRAIDALRKVVTARQHSRHS